MNPNTAPSFRDLQAVRAHRPDWLDGCLVKIDGLSELNENWNSYGARPVNPRSIELAKEVVAHLAHVTGVECPRVAASPDGNAALSWEWHESSRELDLEIVPDGTMRYSYVDEHDSSRDTQGETDDPNLIARLLTQW